MLSARPACFLAIILTFLLLVAPGAWTSAFAGSPLTLYGRIALGVVFVLAWMVVLLKPERRMPWIVPGVLAGLVAIKMLIAGWSVPTGFQGVYRSDAPDAPAHGFVTRFRAEPFRVDEKLAFQGQDFNLHFLNNFQKYAVYYTSVRRDHQYPLFVTWTGYAVIDEPTPLELGVAAAGHVRLEVDGQTVLEREKIAGSELLTTPVLSPGLRRIVFSYEKPANTDPLVWLQVFHPRGHQLRIVPWVVPAEAVTREPLLAMVTTACLAIGFLVLAAGLVRAYAPIVQFQRTPLSDSAGRLAAMGLLVALTAMSLTAAAPWRERTADLSAGDDWLAYEGNARDILHHGVLMTGGKPLGQGAPYYFYPFYPYAVAAGHSLIGEDYGALVIVNGFAIASMIPLAFLLAWRDARWPVTLGGLAALTAFVVYHVSRYTVLALSDSVFMATALAALLLCRMAIDRWSPRWWVFAGIAMAMAAATRPNFLTFVPMFAAAVALLWRGGTFWTRGTRSALVACGFIIGVMPFTLRNWVVSGKIVMLVNSWVQIPYFLVPPGVKNPVSAANTSTVGSAVTVALEMFRNDPWGILWVECRKVLFTLGYIQPPIGIEGVHTPHWELVALSLLFVTALVTRRLRGSLAFVLSVFAVSHMAAMVLAAPWTYGYKTILPLHAVFLLGAAHLLAPGRVSARSGERVPSAIADVPHSLRV